MATRTEESVLKFTGDAKSALSTLKQMSSGLKGLWEDMKRLGNVPGGQQVLSLFKGLGQQAKQVGWFAQGALKGVRGNILDLLNPLNIVHGAIGMVGNAFRGLGDIVKTALGVALGNALSVIAEGFGQVMQQPVLLAARVGELEHVFEFLGQKAHYSRDALQGFATSMKDLGITTQDSLRGLTRMIQTNLDLNRAMELGNVARNAAVVSGENTSQAFEGLIQGVITLNSRVLRNHGAFVNLEEQFRKTAEASDRSTDSLSMNEKQQIALNAVIQAGAAVEGAYTTAMENVGKRLRSIPRWAEEAAVALGRGGVPILGAFVDILEDSLKGIQKWFDDRRPIFEGFGLAAAEGIRTGWEQVKAFLAEITGTLVPDTDPAEWFRSGLEIVVNLAEGLLQGLTDYVIPAVVTITQAIAGFLMAASPPKKGVLSSIAKWGSSLINEYLKGFAKADFGILKQVGSMIYNALKSAVTLGDLAESQLVPTFQKAREMVAGLIANFRKTGEISEEVLGRIAQLLGEGGAEYVKYLRLQLEYQKALKDVAAIEEEYAAAEAAGFVPAALKEKLAAAKEAADAKAEEMSWQEQYLQAQQESVDLQAQQVRTMEKLAKAVSDVASAMKSVKMPEVKLPEVISAEDVIPDFSGKVDEATGKISEAALMWKDKFLQAFEPLGRLKESLAGVWESIKDPETRQAFADLVEGIGKLPGKVGEWLAKLQEILAWFEGLPEWVKSILKGLAIFVGINFLTAGLAGQLGTALVGAGLSLGPLGWGLAILATLILTNKEELGKWFAPEAPEEGRLFQIGAVLKNALYNALPEGEVKNWYDRQFMVPMAEALQGGQTGLLTGAQSGIRDPLVQAADEAKTQIVGQSIVPEMVTSVVRWLTQLRTQAVAVLTQLKTRAIQIFTQIKTGAINLIQQMVEGILESLAELRDESEGILAEIAEIFEAMADRIGDALDEIFKKIRALKDELQKLIEKAEEAKSALEDAGLLGESPSRFEMSLEGINQALRQVQATMGGFPTTLQYQAMATAEGAPVAAAVGAAGGNTFQFYEGAFAGAFPAVRDGRDAEDFWDRLLRQAEARASLPGGVL